MSRKLAPICQKGFLNKFYLISLNDKILFDVTGTKKKSPETNRAYVCCLHPKCGSSSLSLQGACMLPALLLWLQVRPPPRLSMRLLRVPSRSLAPAPNRSSICHFSCSSLCLSAHPERHRANRALQFSIVLCLVSPASDLLSLDLNCDSLLWLYRCKPFMASVT